jgi:hypothetical protein
MVPSDEGQILGQVDTGVKAPVEQTLDGLLNALNGRPIPSPDSLLTSFMALQR